MMDGGGTPHGGRHFLAVPSHCAQKNYQRKCKQVGAPPISGNYGISTVGCAPCHPRTGEGAPFDWE